VDVGQTLNDKEYIGMCRREVMDDFLRKRAKSLGANLVNGLFMKLEDPGRRATARSPSTTTTTKPTLRLARRRRWKWTS
jgi:hypothetical protein